MSCVNTDSKTELFRASLKFKACSKKLAKVLPEVIKSLDCLVEPLHSSGEFSNLLGVCQKLNLPDIPPPVVAADVHKLLIQFVLLSPALILHVPDAVRYSNRFTRLISPTIALISVEQMIEALKPVLFWFDALAEFEVNQKTKDVFSKYPSGVRSHLESEEALRQIYEIFYRAYNAAASEQEGTVYTPHPIVKYMVESVIAIAKNGGVEFGKEPMVTLDPAVGIGVFLTHFIRLCPSEGLDCVYDRELYGNDINLAAIVLGTLNMESAYYARTEKYRPFFNLRIVNTLSNEYGKWAQHSP